MHGRSWELQCAAPAFACLKDESQRRSGCFAAGACREVLAQWLDMQVLLSGSAERRLMSEQWFWLNQFLMLRVPQEEQNDEWSEEEVDEARESEEKKLCIPNFCPARLLPHAASSGTRRGRIGHTSSRGSSSIFTSVSTHPSASTPPSHLSLAKIITSDCANAKHLLFLVHRHLRAQPTCSSTLIKSRVKKCLLTRAATPFRRSPTSSQALTTTCHSC